MNETLNSKIKNPVGHLGGDHQKEVDVLNPIKRTEEGKKNKEYLEKF